MARARMPLLLAWCGLLFFYGLSGPLYRTEALRAIIGQAALDGHWLTPTLYGEPFLTKPPGSYAAIALASLPAGAVTESTARLPSAIAATLAVLFAFATLRRFLDERQAFISALLLPMSFLWLDKVPSAEIDMLQLAWVSASLFAFLRATDSGQFKWWGVALLCVAGGFLTKWTAPAFFYFTVGPYLLWQRQFRLLFGWRHLTAAGLAIGLVAAWAIAAASEAGWETLVDTVGREGAQRFGPKGSGKPYPWGESLAFPALVLGAAMPWSAVVLRNIRRSPAHPTLVPFLHCWLWPNLLFWSLPAQHNVRYVLPIVPAITLLGVLCLPKWATSRQAVLAMVLAWAITKVVFVEVVVPNRTADRNARETGEAIAALVPDGQPLHVCRLKDEGVMFYYGRPAQRFVWDYPPEGCVALLIEAEWAEWAGLGRVELLGEFRDQQKAPLYLVRIGPREADACPKRPATPPSPSAP